MENESGSKFEKRKGLRILALALTAIILFNLFIGMEAQIRFSEREFAGKVAQYAARVTEENTEYLSKKDLDRAWDILKTLVRKPQTYDDYDMYASIAIAREDYESAVQYMQGCIDSYDGGSAKELALLYLRLASLCVLTGRYSEALDHLNLSASLDRSLSSVYFMRAEMKMVLGDTDGATEDVARYLELDGGDPVIMESLGQLYEVTGEPARAAECYALATDTDIHAYVDRARCLIQTEDTKGARDCLTAYRAVSEEDANGEVSALWAVCLMDEGDYTGAAESFRKAAENGYPSPQLMHEQAMMCSYIAGDYEKAVLDGEKAVKAEKAAGESPAATENLTGLCLLVLGRYSEAEKYIMSAIAEDPELEDTRYYLGICAMSLEDNERAVKLFTESVERGESVTPSLYDRAVCRLNTGDISGAVSDLREVIARNDEPDLTQQARDLLDSIW